MRRALLFIPFLIACTQAEAPERPRRGGGKADGVDTNVDAILAQLTVTAPAAGDGKVSYRRGALALGSVAQYAPGIGCLTIASSFWGKSFDVDCDLTLAPGSAKSIPLSLLSTTSDPSNLTVDFGLPGAVASVSWNGKTIGKTLPAGAIVPAGDYGFVFNYGVLGEVEQHVGVGEVIVADLTVPDRRATITIVPPSQRLYPNPTPQGCESKERIALVRRRGDAPIGINDPLHVTGGKTSLSVVDARSFDLDQPRSFRVFPLTGYEKAQRYELVVNNLAQSISLSPGDAIELPLKRIDVNDVNVTSNDGTVIKTPGTFEIFRKAGSAWEQLALTDAEPRNAVGCVVTKTGRSIFPTKTGLDVLPGTYKVVVAWTSLLGAQSAEHILDLN